MGFFFLERIQRLLWMLLGDWLRKVLLRLETTAKTRPFRRLRRWLRMPRRVLLLGEDPETAVDV